MLIWQTLDSGKVAARIVSQNHGDLFFVFLDEKDDKYFYEIKDPQGKLMEKHDGFESMLKVRDAAEEKAKKLVMKFINRR